MKIVRRSTTITRRVLGIDPGTNALGYAILEKTGNTYKLLEVGVHKTPSKATHPEKLRSIFDTITALIKLHSPEECAIESPFFGKNVQSMLKLGRAQGVAMAAAISQGLTVEEYAPKKIKMSVTGNGNSSKEQVAEMLGHLIKFDRSGVGLDATDALGAAVCHLNQSGLSAKPGESYSGWKQFVDQNPARAKR
ncbi:MAG: crossover junction endodeoxyribonuclease RuvC [Saprospiraceae bacterium]